jgi:hypothetical protein
MDKEQFQIDVAQFFFDRLKESGSWMYFSKLQDATKVYFQERISELSDNEFWGYTRRAKELLFELELVDVSSGTLTLRADAFMMPDSTKIKDLLAQKKKKDQFDAHKSQRDFYVSIGGGVVALLGFLWNILSEQGSYGQMIGWILVGFAFGYFVNELINKR